MDLVASLIREQESRICSRRYQYGPASSSSSSSASRGRPERSQRDWTGRAVYPHDAEDIKSHKWFRDLPWDRLHQIEPPFVPQISSLEDTHYFDEEEPISDWSESQSESSTASQGADCGYPSVIITPGGAPAAPATMFGGPPPSSVRRSGPLKAAIMQSELASFPPHVRAMLSHFVAAPYDAARLKRMDQEIEAVAAAAHRGGGDAAAACTRMKGFVRAFGRRERKRPRDRLLRDRKTKRVALEVRKQTAFLGYTYRRSRQPHAGGAAGGTFGGSSPDFVRGKVVVERENGGDGNGNGGGGRGKYAAGLDAASAVERGRGRDGDGGGREENWVGDDNAEKMGGVEIENGNGKTRETYRNGDRERGRLEMAAYRAWSGLPGAG